MNIAILGYGKMGQTIEKIAFQKKYTIGLRISSSNKDALDRNALKNIDVAIDFSHPKSAFNHIKICLENKVPVVSGTTAWLEHLEEAKTMAENQETGFVYASNFSIGVNIFFALNKRLAQFMDAAPQYRPSVHEIHHTQKIDAPSGTGISLGEDIVENLERIDSWKKGDNAATNELPITSERIGKTPGTHLVTYSSAIDDIEIKHTAKSREGFARGAILAAEWIIGKKGFYGMNDVLNLR